MEFDDFNRLEIPGGLGGKGGGQHRSEGKVRRNEDAHVRLAGQQGLQLREPAGVPARGPHHGVHAVLDGEADVRFRALRHRQVHDDPGA
jgi:hypothetical protein